MTDIIDHLAGIPPGSALDEARRKRAEARVHAQASHDLLLLPADPGGFELAERWAVAAFVAGLHNQAETAAYYAQGLAERAPALAAKVADAAARGQATGPVILGLVGAMIGFVSTSAVAVALSFLLNM